MKTWLLAALVLALLPASASAGTITGQLQRRGTPRTVRVVRADTGGIVAAKRLGRPRYKLKVASGPYLVVAGAGKRTFRSRIVRVGRRDTRKAPLRRARMAAGDAPLAILAVDPNIEIAGVAVSGGMVTVDLVMRGKVDGSSSVTVPLSQLPTMTEKLASDLKGQICRPTEQPSTPPPPLSRPAYAGSLSGSAVIPSPAGATTETWSATGVRLSRTAGSSDSAPNYEGTAGALQFSVTGTIGGCTLSGSKAMPLAVAAGDSESTLDLAPDNSYFAVGYPNDTLDVTHRCPDGDPFTTTYTAMNEFLRTNPAFQRRRPGPNGAIAGTASASREGKQLSWTWSLTPRQ